ncbi:MAG: TRAP transporter substrate-binding protein [Spirochaetes bacterium]|nr:TRAP transporter substrate-binding protein [Spirochaetota bacterium]
MKKTGIILLIIIALFAWFNCSLNQSDEKTDDANLLTVDKNNLDLEEVERCFINCPKKPPIVLKAALTFAEGHILHDYFLKFEEIAEAITRGKLQVEVMPSAGSEADVNIMCSVNEVQMQATGGQALQVFAPQYFFFNAPYVIKDWDHFNRVWDGELGNEARALIEANGHMKDTGTVYRGLRQMTSNNVINGPADIVGLKLRLPVVPVWIAVWESLGAVAVPIPLGGLYDALATGAADASEGDATQILSYKLYEVQSNLTMTNHLLAVGYTMVNTDFYNSLPFAYKLVILVSSYVACDYATDKMMAGEQGTIDELIANGMVQGFPDAEAIRVQAKPAIDQLFLTEWPVTTWDEVLAQ